MNVCLNVYVHMRYFDSICVHAYMFMDMDIYVFMCVSVCLHIFRNSVVELRLGFSRVPYLYLNE
jgi:hypothetical protein